MTKSRIILITLFLCHLTMSTLAQKNIGIRTNKSSDTSVTMVKTNDIISGDDRRWDKNKRLCAVVKVEVLDEIIDVDGFMLEKLNHGVEKWIYMAQGSKNMKIHLKNNLPVTVVFRDYGIKALESNRVYVVRLNVPNKVGANVAEVKHGILQMRVTPKNAMVHIWGDGKEAEPYRLNQDGVLKASLPYGKYRYKVTANAFRSAEGEVIVVGDDNKWEDINLEEIKGKLLVNCPTKKAELYIDNNLIGEYKNNVSWRGLLSPGSHIVEVRRKGYVGFPQTVNVLGDQEATIILKPLMTEKAYKKALASKGVDFNLLRIGVQSILEIKDGSTVSGVWMGVEDYMAKVRQESPNGIFYILLKEISNVKQLN